MFIARPAQIIVDFVDEFDPVRPANPAPFEAALLILRSLPLTRRLARAVDTITDADPSVRSKDFSEAIDTLRRFAALTHHSPTSPPEGPGQLSLW